MFITINFLVILLLTLIGGSVAQMSMALGSASNSTEFIWKDDSVMTSILDKVNLINLGNDNLRLKFDMNSMRWEADMTAQKTLLGLIKEMLEKQQKYLDTTILNEFKNSTATVCDAVKNMGTTVQNDMRTQKDEIVSLKKLMTDNFAKLNEKWEREMKNQSETLGRIEKLLQALYNKTITMNVTQACAPQKIVAAEKLPSTCAEVFASGNKSDVYQLYLNNIEPFYAYCLQDPNNGSAWTIVQRRRDGSTDFYRNWSEYKFGFGNIHNEYFLGLEKIHAMTHAQPHELWIQLEDFNGHKVQAKYSAFAIDQEATKYTLNVLGKFTGNASDALYFLLGQKFTTHDNDNDESQNVNCAVALHGAWWYKSCHDCNMNGNYLTAGSRQTLKGLHWSYYDDPDFIVKYAHIAIRPVQ